MCCCCCCCCLASLAQRVIHNCMHTLPQELSDVPLQSHSLHACRRMASTYCACRIAANMYCPSRQAALLLHLFDSRYSRTFSVSRSCKERGGVHRGQGSQEKRSAPQLITDTPRLPCHAARLLHMTKETVLHCARLPAPALPPPLPTQPFHACPAMLRSCCSFGGGKHYPPPCPPTPHFLLSPTPLPPRRPLPPCSAALAAPLSPSPTLTLGCCL